MVEGGSLHSGAELVVLVDYLLNGVVFALAGCGDYSDRLVASPAWLMKFVNQLYELLVLCGGGG